MALPDRYPIALRNAQAKPIGEALQDMLRHFDLQRRLNETRVLSEWNCIVGAATAARTQKLYIENKKLFVHLNSAPLKAQLRMSKGLLLARIAEVAGEGAVEDVVFL